MKKIAIIFSILLAATGLSAATYSVCDSGCDYTTIATALAACSDGTENTITVRNPYSGNESVTVNKGGASNTQRIIIESEVGYTAPIKRLYVSTGKNNITLNRFAYSGHATNYTGMVELAANVSNVTISNSTFTGNGSNNIHGIETAGTNDNILITGNTLDTINYVFISATLTNSTISYNTLSNNDNGWDALNLWGHDIIIENNYFTEINLSGTSHTDLFQTFSNVGYDKECYNITIRSNLMYNNNCQIGSTSNQSGNGKIHDIVWYNNIFINQGFHYSGHTPASKFYNNTFYNCSKDLVGYILSFGDGSGDSPPVGVATDGVVINNLFISSGNSTSTGWYVLEGATVPTSFTANNNYVTHGVAHTEKTGFSETNGINGGDPLFTNIGGTTANDYTLTTASPARDAGDTITSFSIDYSGASRPAGAAWDIGAYEYGAGASTLTLPAGVVIGGGVEIK